jgi:inner membrane protein
MRSVCLCLRQANAKSRRWRASFEIDDPEQIAIQAKPQQLATAIKQGRKLEFNSCPLTVALNLLREQWGSGQVRIRVVLNNN